jgi:geranylgeranyl pyrophosphate synthase
MNAPEIEKNLKNFIQKNSPHHDSHTIYDYALFPSGKLIRSQFLYTLVEDLGGPNNSDLMNMANFLEVHHAYSLVHDDLPCMDNDDMRRGKASTHKAFGEWKALLIGDGLLVLSFQALANLNNLNLKSIFRFATFATGPKGLIHGQYLDLNKEMNLNMKILLKTHELKTARLFQLASLFAYLHATKDIQLKKMWGYWKLGLRLGIVFQLLDDLQELTEENINQEERSKNPFFTYTNTFELLNNEFKKLQNSLNNFPQTKQFLNLIYFSQINDKLNHHRSRLIKNGVGEENLNFQL